MAQVNLVVWVADALRVDHVGCYGAQQVATPTIDHFAAGGARFDQAISAAPWTAPSTASMITGLYPHHHGYLHWDAEPDPAHPSLFTVAAAYGYETGSFVFDERYLFRDFPRRERRGHERAAGRRRRVAARARPRSRSASGSTAGRRTCRTAFSTRSARSGSGRRKTSSPASSPATRRRSTRLRDSYRAAVERESEQHFAGFLQALEELGLREQTAIAFVSDHGESWGERYADKSLVKGTYHMHGADLYDEIVRVPLILVAPGRVGSAVIPSQVSLVDLMPTLLELADAPIDGLDGRSLLPVVESAERDDRPAFIAGTDKGAVSQLALRQPPWKMTVHVQSGEEQAYRLDEDAGELVDRANEVPGEVRERLYAELETVSRRELSAEEEALVEQRLSDLGYL